MAVCELMKTRWARAGRARAGRKRGWREERVRAVWGEVSWHSVERQAQSAVCSQPDVSCPPLTVPLSSFCTTHLHTHTHTHIHTHTHTYTSFPLSLLSPSRRLSSLSPPCLYQGEDEVLRQPGRPALRQLQPRLHVSARQRGQGVGCGCGQQGERERENVASLRRGQEKL